MRWKAEKGGGERDKRGDKMGWLLDVTPWDRGGVREEGSIHNNQHMVGGKGLLAKGEVPSGDWIGMEANNFYHP
jgi:hypothetical protein